MNIPKQHNNPNSIAQHWQVLPRGFFNKNSNSWDRTVHAPLCTRARGICESSRVLPTGRAHRAGSNQMILNRNESSATAARRILSLSLSPSRADLELPCAPPFCWNWWKYAQSRINIPARYIRTGGWLQGARAERKACAWWLVIQIEWMKLNSAPRCGCYCIFVSLRHWP